MTDLTVFQREISRLLPNVELRYSEPMSRHTSFRIGGPVEVMAFPKSREELSKILKVSKLLDVSFAILGAGTNVLAPDEGISGLVICLKDALDGMELLDETHLRVMAGVTMREKEDGRFKISLRTNAPIDAMKICKTFGGGGHPRAAGCEFKRSPETIKEQLLPVIKEALEEQGCLI